MFDKNLMLLDSVTDVKADVTGAAIDFRGEDPVEVHYRCVVPAVGEESVPKERLKAPLYWPISLFENSSVKRRVPPEGAL